MNDSKDPTDFVRALLTQETALAPAEFESQRLRLLDRLGRAECRERRARRITVAVAVFILLWLAMLYLSAMREISKGSEWPDWFQYLAALSFICLPVAVLLLGIIYLLRHRRELNGARQQAQQQTFLGMQHEITELKQRLAGAKPATGATDRCN